MALDTIRGHWQKLIPAKPKKAVHHCQVPDDGHVGLVAAVGSEWVCDECGRIWEVRKVGIYYGVTLYPTRRYERGGGEPDADD